MVDKNLKLLENDATHLRDNADAKFICLNVLEGIKQFNRLKVIT